MRRPNGTGTIVKLSGNRRRPYVVRIPSRDRRGRVIQQPLGYYATVPEAQTALDDYNAHRSTGTAPAPDKLSMTLEDVYQLWSARKYARSGTSSVASYKASWNRLFPLSGYKLRDITTDQLQAVIDQGEAAGLSMSSLSNDKLLMRTLFAFALERDIIAKDYAQFVKLPHVDPKHEKGAFNDLQMRKLEELAASGFPWADTVLLLCYTGFRVSEFLSLTPFSYHTEAGVNYLQGGLKTAAGKNRVVPVHPKIQPYLDRRLAQKGETIICAPDGAPVPAYLYREKFFKPVAEALGLPQATPHWCRHTFATRSKVAGMDDLARKRILGHANGSVTDRYTHDDLQWLQAQLNRVS